MKDLKFVSIKEKKDEKTATFKKVYTKGQTEITLSLAILVENESENFESLIEDLRAQAVKDFKKVFSIL